MINLGEFKFDPAKTIVLARSDIDEIWYMKIFLEIEMELGRKIPHLSIEQNYNLHEYLVKCMNDFFRTKELIDSL